MTSRVSSKNKGKQAKRKNSAKLKLNRRLNCQKKNKNGTKKQKIASPGVEPSLSARASNSLTTAPQ